CDSVDRGGHPGNVGAPGEFEVLPAVVYFSEQPLRLYPPEWAAPSCEGEDELGGLVCGDGVGDAAQVESCESVVHVPARIEFLDDGAAAPHLHRGDRRAVG